MSSLFSSVLFSTSSPWVLSHELWGELRLLLSVRGTHAQAFAHLGTHQIMVHDFAIDKTGQVRPDRLLCTCMSVLLVLLVLPSTSSFWCFDALSLGSVQAYAICQNLTSMSPISWGSFVGAVNFAECVAPPLQCMLPGTVA